MTTATTAVEPAPKSLILIPLGAAAFLTLGRHPLAGMAAAFAGVASVFGVNLLITPIDSMITAITNEAINLVTLGASLTVTANYYFSVVSTLVLAVVAAVITERMIEPRLGPYKPEAGASIDEEQGEEAKQAEPIYRSIQYRWPCGS